MNPRERLDQPSSGFDECLALSAEAGEVKSDRIIQAPRGTCLIVDGSAGADGTMREGVRQYARICEVNRASNRRDVCVLDEETALISRGTTLFLNPKQDGIRPVRKLGRVELIVARLIRARAYQSAIYDELDASRTRKEKDERCPAQSFTVDRRIKLRSHASPDISPLADKVISWPPKQTR